MVYDVIVIGKGLIGSATAKYLSGNFENVLLTGPNEPENYQNHDGVFSSHYDEGRLAYNYGHSPLSTLLNKKSLGNFKNIEKESGIKFHFPVGVIRSDFLNPEDSELKKYIIEAKNENNFQGNFYEPENTSWHCRFPRLNFPAENWVLYVPAPAGYINPRRLVQAQIKIAEKQNVQVKSETATAVIRESEEFKITTKEKNEFKCKKLVICTGAFANCYSVLQVPLELKIKTEYYLLARVSSKDAESLRGYPCMNYQTKSDTISDIYLTPPILYPDGFYYIKIGANTIWDYYPANFKEISHWFKSGGSNAADSSFIEELQKVFRDVEIVEHVHKACIITYTQSGYPIISPVGNNMYAAVGGNGFGAKSSDYLGYTAAYLALHNKLPDGIPEDIFYIKTNHNRS